MKNPALDQQIMEAHARFDSFELADLYHQAARLKLAQNDSEASGFLLTQAYVYALESGHPDAGKMRATLVLAGRESEEQSTGSSVDN